MAFAYGVEKIVKIKPRITFKQFRVIAFTIPPLLQEVAGHQRTRFFAISQKVKRAFRFQFEGRDMGEVLGYQAVVCLYRHFLEVASGLVLSRRKGKEFVKEVRL